MGGVIHIPPGPDSLRSMESQPFFDSQVFINMRYVISESRLERMFNNYMDSQYDLTYDSSPREFVDKNGDIFGFMILYYQFDYVDYSTEYTLNQMFGELTDELLLSYLREKFPDIRIDGIE
jgi:hypothetical protein